MELTVKQMIDNIVRNAREDRPENGIDIYMQFVDEDTTKRAYEHFDKTMHVLDSYSMDENKLYFACDEPSELEEFVNIIGVEKIIDVDAYWD